MINSYHESQNRVPSWDGNPLTRQTFLEEVKLWALSEDLDAKYSLAARLVKNLKGPARRACHSLTPKELAPVRAKKEGDREYLMAGINNVFQRLEHALGVEPATRKGQKMEAFFGTQKYWRHPGERVADWTTRWNEGVQNLETDGVYWMVYPTYWAGSGRRWRIFRK